MEQSKLESVVFELSKKEAHKFIKTLELSMENWEILSRYIDTFDDEELGEEE